MPVEYTTGPFSSTNTGFYFNVLSYGAVGDGATDNTSAITAAITAAGVNGGTVFFPAGTYITGPQTLLSNVFILGSGKNNTSVRLKTGSNADLFSASVGNITAVGSAFGSGSNTALYNWGFKDIQLDGNNTNQSGTSWGLRVYGAQFLIDNLRIINCLTGGWYNDWNGSALDVATLVHPGQVKGLEIYGTTNSNGLTFTGPHDTEFDVGFIGFCGQHCFQLGPNSSATKVANFHTFAPNSTTGLAYLIEGQAMFSNCIAEGSSSNLPQVALLSSLVDWDGGLIFAFNPSTGSGIQIGQQAGNTPYVGQANQSAGLTTAVSPSGYKVDTFFNNCVGSNGAIWFANDGGGSIDADITQSSGSYVTGTPGANSNFRINGRGLTATGSSATGGIFQVRNSAFAGFIVGRPDGTTLLDIDTFSGNLDIENNANLIGFSDGGSTVTWRVQNGTFYGQQSATAVAIATNGAIATNVGVSRLAPAAAVTGITMNVGTFGGQICWVINEAAAANTITFNTTPTTSHVADSATLSAIAGLSARQFVWDSFTSLWYPTQ